MQPSTREFSSRSLDLARYVMTSPMPFDDVTKFRAKSSTSELKKKAWILG